MLTNKQIRKIAASMALRSGSLVRLTLGVCICVASLIIALLIPSLAVQLVQLGAEEIDNGVAMASLVASFLIVLFFAVPVIGGFYLIAYKMYRVQDVGIADIFSVFGSAKRYFKVVFAGGLMLLRLIVIFSIPGVISSAFSQSALIPNGIFGLLLSWAATAVATVLAVFFACGTMQMYYVPYFLCRGYGAAEALQKSRDLLRGRRIAVLKYLIGFAGHVSLSLLTVGALFVVYTIPLMTFAYFIQADQMTLNKQTQKEGI